MFWHLVILLSEFTKLAYKKNAISIMRIFHCFEYFSLDVVRLCLFTCPFFPSLIVPSHAFPSTHTQESPKAWRCWTAPSLDTGSVLPSVSPAYLYFVPPHRTPVYHFLKLVPTDNKCSGQAEGPLSHKWPIRPTTKQSLHHNCLGALSSLMFDLCRALLSQLFKDQ